MDWRQAEGYELTHRCLIIDVFADLEWKLTYVGSAESEKYDQLLDTVYVGPVAPGQYRFVFQADPPDFLKIPKEDIVGVTIILLTCCYRDQEFIRVGYYVNNEYADEALREEPPATPQIDKLVRNILADKPRVTRFPISWDNKENIEGQMLDDPPATVSDDVRKEAYNTESRPVGVGAELPTAGDAMHID